MPYLPIVSLVLRSYQNVTSNNLPPIRQLLLSRVSHPKFPVTYDGCPDGLLG
jgi:hypothetical protein